jgi:hydroxyacylglutathione hydrolase
MRRQRRLVWVAVAVLVTLVVALFTARAMRRRSSPPAAVGDRVQRERNLFTELYGARAGDGVILFDAGVDPAGGALDRLLGSLLATRSDVREVFLTHGHFDHVAATPLCVHAKVRVGAEDVEFMAKRAPAFATPMVKFLMLLYPVPPVYATHPLHGREEIAVGDDKVLAIPTPGHTPGSYVFVFAGVLLAGDSMIIDGDRLDFAAPIYTVDPATNRRALAALGEALDGVAVHTVCTGHQGCTPPGRGQAMLAALIERAKAAK